MAFFSLCRLKRPPVPSRQIATRTTGSRTLNHSAKLFRSSNSLIVEKNKNKQKTPHENQTRSRSPIETNKSSAQMDVSIWKERERGGDYDPLARWETEVNTQWLETQRDVEYKSGFCIFFPLSYIWFPFASSEAVFYVFVVFFFFVSLPPSFPPCWWCESFLFEQFHNIIVKLDAAASRRSRLLFLNWWGGTQKWVAELFRSWAFKYRHLKRKCRAHSSMKSCQSFID